VRESNARDRITMQLKARCFRANGMKARRILLSSCPRTPSAAAAWSFICARPHARVAGSSPCLAQWR